MNNRLDIIAKKLGSVDRHIVHLLARRIRLAKEVAMIKVEDESSLYRKEIERKRLDQISEWAKLEGINDEFARSLLYQIIGESCKTQMSIIDNLRLGGEVEKFQPSYEDLRKNLIYLTDKWAPKYDTEYGSDHVATKALVEFERELINKLTEKTSGFSDTEAVIDLGCATGREIRKLAKRFCNLQGFDISPRMIECGCARAFRESLHNVSLKVHDIEKGLPIPNNSISFVIMNGGTGSDIMNLPFVLEEIKRVLKTGGRFLISFYNKEAWAQKIFFPWPLSTIAEIDQDRNCLEVYDGENYIPIFAKPYSMEEIRDILPRGLTILQISSYPTLSSVLPNEIINGTGKDIIKVFDSVINQYGNVEWGSYIVVGGEKV